MNTSIGTKVELQTGGFESTAIMHIDSAYRFALYMTGSEDDAQRLVLKMYLRGYRLFDRFRLRTSPKIWQLAILSSMFMDIISGHERLQATCLLERDEMELPGDACSQNSIPEDLSEHDVAAALSMLPAECRAIILLADMEGLSYKEVADVVGCPVETVMFRLCRGRRLLARKLQSLSAQGG